MIKDDNGPISIDEKRNIIIPLGQEEILISGDSYSQIITFKIKSTIDSISLNDKEISIKVVPQNYQNGGGIYIVPNSEISLEGPYLYFNWQVPKEISYMAGDYLFCILFKGTTEVNSEEQDYVLTTKTAKLKVEETIYPVSDISIEYNENLYEQYLNEVDTKINNIDFIGKKYIVDNNAKGEIFNDYTYNIASGYCSHAEGDNTTASGICSHAEGAGATASGNYSHAEGESATASGHYSHAEGILSTASGNYSHAEGNSSTASETCSHAEGYYAEAKGGYSHAEGFLSIAGGYSSHVEGEGTTAETYALHTQGRYNKTNTGKTNTFSATQNAFVIGNGTSFIAKSNAFRVDFSGNTYGLSAFNSTGADYAEYFEWEDKNLNKEDRIGYFVSLNKEGKIKIANNIDKILGIVSGTAGVIGDSYEDTWNGMYMKDEFGRLIYEDVEITYPEKKIGDKIIEKERTVTERHIKLNPNYDSTETYIPRSQRKEWSCIGALGKIIVRDDGTCEIGSNCVCNENGIATKSLTDEGWTVLERISDNIVKIWFK